ncbi:sortase [Microbacterium hydrothermale]|uniref:sortase n=1 Tax=Microbacterium hydrothermale TaxID=857427 RepID=UPI001F0E406F|nr:sortase [Microbacterium hydrothermale]
MTLLGRLGPRWADTARAVAGALPFPVASRRAGVAASIASAPIATPTGAAAPRGARPGSGPMPPRPPRRPPRARPVYAPLAPGQVFLRGMLVSLSVLVLVFLVNLLVISHVSHFAAQQQARDTFRAQLAAGTAPVSEGDFEDHLLPDGAPVGILSIPQLGVDEVISEGTTSGVLMHGPGHRRDTVLPGQAGVSVLMGRAAAFGGPFGGLQSLQPGETFTVRTGQGEQTFEVLGVRYAGDPTPPAPVRGESRLILMTARGAPYLPTGVAYLDARATGAAKPAGARQTTSMTLPPQAQPLATDMTTVWALVFALQLLVVAEFVAVWAYRRVGWQKTWIVFAPVLLLASVFVSDQLIRLLPNLL